MKSDFIPKRDGDLNAFEDNFLGKLNNYASVLELDSAEIDSARAIIEAHRASFSNLNSKKAESKSATEVNNIKKDEALSEIRRLASKIKSCRGYTSAIGDDLGIIGADIPFVARTNLKPELKTKIQGSNVILSFIKDGTDGIKIYSRRSNETEFSFLAIDTSSPYNDTRDKIEPSKPESREYYANYFEDDRDIGQRSDIVKATIP